MFARQPILGRLLIQKAGHVFDLPVRAVAYDLPVALANLYGFENHMRLDHSPNMRPGPAVFQWSVNATIKLTHYPNPPRVVARECGSVPPSGGLFVVISS